MRLDESPCARDSLFCSVLIQRNRFSLTHAMDTLIPSFSPADTHKFHGQTKQLWDKMRTHTATVHGKGRGSWNDPVPPRKNNRSHIVIESWDVRLNLGQIGEQSCIVHLFAGEQTKCRDTDSGMVDVLERSTDEGLHNCHVEDF